MHEKYQVIKMIVFGGEKGRKNIRSHERGDQITDKHRKAEETQQQVQHADHTPWGGEKQKSQPQGRYGDFKQPWRQGVTILAMEKPMVHASLKPSVRICLL